MRASVRVKDEVATNGTHVPTLKPPLKWAGGKRWLVPELQKLWKPFRDRRYVEPFCGGLAAALGLAPEHALLNDVNPHLINFYHQLKTGLKLQLPLRYDEELFYQYRERFNQLIRKKQADSAKAAQLFYYLNRTCFNGLCRFNQSGEFNVPFGTYSKINYVRDFSGYINVFAQWTFSNCDIGQLIFEPEDFVYADPPYDVEFTTYSAGGFSWEDQVRTAELLSNHRGPVIISNQATDRILKLYKQLKFKLYFLDAPRRISCTGDRTKAKEVLATRNL